jgi:Skp family chaperone for outer membrane proteins
MKLVLWAAAAVALPTLLAHAVAGQSRAGTAPRAIGYISSQRILAEANDARAEFGRFQAAQKRRADELRALQRALETTRKELAAATDPARRSELRQQELGQRLELERAAAQAQSDLRASQRQLNAELRTLLKPVMDDLMKGSSTEIVVDAESVVWAAPGTDLTDAVIKRLNARPAAAPPAKPGGPGR